MSDSTHYLACDLGAESGRVMLGTLNGGRITLEEIHRFPTGALKVRGTLRWDLLRLFAELKTGLELAARSKPGLPIRGISTDSWGVDYVLLQGAEPMLTVPYHYRDARTEGGFARAFAVVPKEEIFAQTGIQFLDFNTLYQLHADVRERPAVLALAEQFLPIADYFNFLFSGRAAAEESLASTTQLYNPKTRQWALPLIEKLGIPARLFPEVVPSGTRLGPVLPGALEGNWAGTEVVATCSHDTGAAVAAVPAEGEDWAYLSSGTWSLLGIESDHPFLDGVHRDENFTNELGYGGTVRFLKNIVGLWIVQECRRAWAKEGNDLSYAALCDLAAGAAPLKSLIHPADARFAKPDRMPEKVADYCRETGQPVPEGTAQIVRCVLESLALLYASTLERLETLTCRRIGKLHIVGGGSRNDLLNQATADALERPVHAGPAEATAIGNILIQALALGDLSSLAELRKVVRDSFPLSSFTPRAEHAGAWRVARARFAGLPKAD